MVQIPMIRLTYNILIIMLHMTVLYNYLCYVRWHLTFNCTITFILKEYIQILIIFYHITLFYVYIPSFTRLLFYYDILIQLNLSIHLNIDNTDLHECVYILKRGTIVYSTEVRKHSQRPIFARWGGNTINWSHLYIVYSEEMTNGCCLTVIDENRSQPSADCIY